MSRTVPIPRPADEGRATPPAGFTRPDVEGNADAEPAPITAGLNMHMGWNADEGRWVWLDAVLYKNTSLSVDDLRRLERAARDARRYLDPDEPSLPLDWEIRAVRRFGVWTVTGWIDGGDGVGWQHVMTTHSIVQQFGVERMTEWIWAEERLDGGQTVRVEGPL